MQKIRTLLKAPLLTQSGYGVHSRQIFDALMSDPVFDVYVESLNWGQTSFITENTPQRQQITECINKCMGLKQQGQEEYDLFIHVTIPNEFEKKAKFNIGVTAGIETDRVSHVWVQKCNEMDLIIVPSLHAKHVFDTTVIEWQNPQNGTTGNFKVSKPIVVCAEGVDTQIFKQKPYENKLGLELDSDFNFLHVGQWGGGNFGEDRKNISLMLKYFIETFKGRKDVGMVLKTNMAKNSVADFEAVKGRIAQLKQAIGVEDKDCPPIYLVHANLSNEEMADLYNHPKIKAFITLTHGEGFGIPVLEAAAVGMPILATNWSGHLDILKEGKFIPLDFDMTEIPDSVVWDPVLIKGSRWASVKEDEVKKRMDKISKSCSMPKQWALELAEKVKPKFDVKETNAGFVQAIKQHILKDVMKEISPVEHLQSFVDTRDSYNVIYTMPMSTGDVYISTAVIDGLVKELPEDSKIYFATDPKYFDVLKGNKNVYKCIPYHNSMVSVDLLEEVFDLALTPNTATQYTFSNWIRRGQGRLLAEEFANHCHTELGDYFVEKDPSILQNEAFDKLSGMPFNENELPYITLHPGSGQGQWEARKYIEWKEVVQNLRNLYPDLKIVQVGGAEEPLYDVDVDLRGKTTIQQLASVIEKAEMHLSIDTFTMHLAAGLNRPLVALFGSSHARSTGPWVKDKATSKFILLEAEQKLGCNKACYKYSCSKNKEVPCINEIDPAQVVESCASLIDEKFGGKFKRAAQFKYSRVFGKLSGYTTTYESMDYPFEESIRSMLGFCDEVVVVDGASKDGTWEVLEKLAEEDPRVKIYQNEFDWSEPAMDGAQKAFARALCENEFLWQQDADEIVHEDDYEKIRMITKRFPNNADVLDLPVVELWGPRGEVTGRRHSWKWRMTRNKPEITHGIWNQARLTDEKTGRVYAKKGASDGCEYVNTMNYEMIPHVGFYSEKIEAARLTSPEEYGSIMNQVFSQLPTVYHYSWFDLPRKIQQLKKGGVWDKMWSLLYKEETQERFPGVETEEQVSELAKVLYEEGGEKSDQTKYKFQLLKTQPLLAREWIRKHSKL